MVSRLDRLLEFTGTAKEKLPIAMAGGLLADSQISNIENSGYIAFGGLAIFTVIAAGYALYKYYKKLRESSYYY